MSTLYIVATPIGNLGDMTPRAVEVLRSVQLIGAEDTRNTIKLLNHFSIATPLTAYHKFNEREKTEELVRRMREEDIDVAIVTDAGTPCISDPGWIIADAAIQSGIPVLAVPGCSAVISALSVSGFDVQRFMFLGFYPRENKEQGEFIQSIRSSDSEVFVIYESPKRLIETLTDVAKAFPRARISVSNDLTKKFEKTVRGDIGEVISALSQSEKTELGEYVVVLEVKKEQKRQEEDPVSPEGMLVDELVKRGGTLKDAVNRLAATEKFRKNELKSAAMRIKELFSI